MSLKQELIKYMLDNDRIPSKEETFQFISDKYKEIYNNRSDGSWWLYKPFILHPENRNKSLTGFIKKELEFFINDLDLSKTHLEDYVMSNEREAINLIRKELKNQLKNFDKWRGWI